MICTKFFLGVSDHVLCFSCDGGLKNWEPNDDPWTEHETWFGQCPYLNLMKNESPETGSTRPETAVAVTVQNLVKSNVTANNVASPNNVAIQINNVNEQTENSKAGPGSTDSGYSSPTEIEVEHMTEAESKGGAMNVKDLQQENEKLKDEKSCRVCFLHESNIVFLPCKHLATCPQCAASLKDCPVCRTPITATIKIYKS